MKIFISHSSHDKWIARKISEELNERGFETFLDEKDIKTGESIDKAIRKHLTECDELLLLLSPQSKASTWVFMEIGGARALQKGVATILINLGANDVPAPLNEALVRELNEIDRYYEELKRRDGGHDKAKRKRKLATKTAAKQKDRKSLGVGSHVTIADPNVLSEAIKQQNPRWVSEMDRFSGKSTVINDVEEKGFYRLQIDGGDYLWHADWLLQNAGQ
jgi:TIR domain